MNKLLSLMISFVISFMMADAQPKEASPRIPPATFNPNDGYVNITELNGGFGIAVTEAPYSEYFSGITSVNGYQINKYFIVGGGTGALVYNEGFLVPLYISERYSHPTSYFKLWWYINTDAGVLLNFKDFDYGTRYFLNPMVGIRYSISQTLAMNIGTGLFSQVGPLSPRDSFINFKLGIIIIPE